MVNDISALMGTSKDDVNLSQLQVLVDVLLEKRQRLDDLQQTMKELNQAIWRLENEQIPEVMGGLSQIRTNKGHTVTLKDNTKVSIIKASAGAAVQWLVDQGHGDLVKTKVITAFDKGDRDQAEELLDEIKQQGHEDVALDESIHHSTMAAFGREQLEKGLEFPSELFNVIELKKVTIKYG